MCDSVPHQIHSDFNFYLSDIEGSNQEEQKRVCKIRHCKIKNEQDPKKRPFQNRQD